jgi:hypothetical protein
MSQAKGIMEKWLLLLSYGHIVAGIVIPFVTYSSAFDYYSGLLQQAFWPGQEVPMATIEFQRWFAALFGPTIASVGVVMVYLVKAGIRYAEPWPWNAILIALAIWAPGDIGITLMKHFWLHVQIDVVVLLALVPPVLILRARAASLKEQVQS